MEKKDGKRDKDKRFHTQKKDEAVKKTDKDD